MLDPGPIPKFLDRTRLVGSYSMLKAYQNCSHQMFRRYIAKDLGPFVESPEMKWGNEVHSAFEHRLRAKKPLPANMQQWESFAVPFDAHPVQVETKMGVTQDGRACDYFAKDVWFRGKLDVILVREDSAYLPDWKSGSSKYEDRFELDIFAVLLQARFPHLRKILGHFIWLKEDRAGEMHDLSDTRETWREMCRLMGEIEADCAKGVFAKTKSGLCGYCSVKDCEHHYVARSK